MIFLALYCLPIFAACLFIIVFRQELMDSDRTLIIKLSVTPLINFFVLFVLFRLAVRELFYED